MVKKVCLGSGIGMDRQEFDKNGLQYNKRWRHYVGSS